MRCPVLEGSTTEISRTVVAKRAINPTLRKALLAFVALVFVLDVGAIAFGEYTQDKEQRYADLRKQMNATGTATRNTRDSLDKIWQSDPRNFVAIQANMRNALGLLDGYDMDLQKMVDLIDTALNQNLTKSENERQQLVLLDRVYKLRQQESAKMREEAGLITDYVPASSDFAAFQSKVKYLDSDLAAISQEATQLLSQIK
jgi:hypothetical protein